MSARDEHDRSVDSRALPLTSTQLVIAIMGHLLIGVMLVVGVQCSPKPPEEIIIDAMLLEEPIIGEKPVTVEQAVKPKPPEPTPPTPEPPKPPEPTPPTPPKPDPEKLRREAEAAEVKAKTEALKREQDQLLAQQQAEEKARQAQEKAQADADAKVKRDAEELTRKTEEQKRLQEIEDARRKAVDEAENKRKAEEKARAQALAAQIAAEEAARMAAVRADAQKLWARALAESLRRNWLRQPGADSFVCKIKIRMLPNGQVVVSSIVSSCGSQLLDDSVLAAANKASPLPLPYEPSAFVPEVTITFRP